MQRAAPVGQVLRLLGAAFVDDLQGEVLEVGEQGAEFLRVVEQGLVFVELCGAEAQADLRTEQRDGSPVLVNSTYAWPLASYGWHTCSMQAFLAALVGGLLAIAGGLAAVLATSRGVRSQWRKDTQLKVSTDVLSALQKMVSRINDLAFLADKESGDAENVWSAHVASATEWNNARHAALLVSSPKVAALLQTLDEQVDSLTTRAVAKQWTLIEFRKERDTLGRLAANYLDAARTETGWPPLQLKSLWIWDVTDTGRAEEPSNVASATAVQTIERQ